MKSPCGKMCCFAQCVCELGSSHEHQLGTGSKGGVVIGGGIIIVGGTPQHCGILAQSFVSRGSRSTHTGPAFSRIALGAGVGSSRYCVACRVRCHTLPTRVDRFCHVSTCAWVCGVCTHMFLHCTRPVVCGEPGRRRADAAVEFGGAPHRLIDLCPGPDLVLRPSSADLCAGVLVIVACEVCRVERGGSDCELVNLLRSTSTLPRSGPALQSTTGNRLSTLNSPLSIHRPHKHI